MRFVKSARKNFLGVLKLQFTTDIDEACPVTISDGMAGDITEKLSRIYGGGLCIEFATDKQEVIGHRQPFYVISIENGSEREYLAGFNKQGVESVTDIRKAYLSQSQRDITEVLGRARQMKVGKARILEVYMNVENTLQQDNFVIIMVGKKSGTIRYYCGFSEGGMLETSIILEKALKFGYDDAVGTFEKIRKDCSNFKLAVIQAPKANVSANALPDYFQSHGNNRNIAVSIKLRD